MAEENLQAMQELLQRINDLELWDFTSSGGENGDLLVLGSNDFSYYHNLEIEFRGVVFSDVPAVFSHARFRLDPTNVDPAVVWVSAVPSDDIGEHVYEIQTGTIAVRIGTVYYYERADNARRPVR